MTRITQKQRDLMVILFKGGSDIFNLANSFGIDSDRVQEIIRQKMNERPNLVPAEEGEL